MVAIRRCKLPISLYCFAALTGGGVEAATHHVESIVATTVNAGRGNKYGQVQVSVIDDLGNPVSGASISGTFTGTFNEAAVEVTDATGVATLSTVATAKGGVSFTFCVDDVVSATTYDASANATTCENL